MSAFLCAIVIVILLDYDIMVSYKKLNKRFDDLEKQIKEIKGIP